MKGARRAAALTGTVLALSPVPLAGAAVLARHYAGRTSQRAPISFTISGGYLRTLRFTIYIRCPSHHIWRIAASSFPPIKVTRGKFAQRFMARGDNGSATVRGSVSGRRVSGSVSDRTFEPTEHHFCSGTAGFDLAGPSGTPAQSGRHGHGHGGSHPMRQKPGHGRPASRFARPGSRYYDAESERLARGPRKEPSKSHRTWIPDSALTAISNGPPGPHRRQPPNR